MSLIKQAPKVVAYSDEGGDIVVVLMGENDVVVAWEMGSSDDLAEIVTSLAERNGIEAPECLAMVASAESQIRARLRFATEMERLLLVDVTNAISRIFSVGTR